MNRKCSRIRTWRYKFQHPTRPLSPQIPYASPQFSHFHIFTPGITMVSMLTPAVRDNVYDRLSQQQLGFFLVAFSWRGKCPRLRSPCFRQCSRSIAMLSSIPLPTSPHRVKAKIHYASFPAASPQQVGAGKSVASVVLCRFPNSITTSRCQL